MSMSRRLPLERSSSILGVAVYLGFLAAVFAGAGTCVYAVFQPVRLPNPGLAAYHPPAAYPRPQLYSAPAPATLAEAQTDAPQAPSATSPRPAQSEAALEAPAPKKIKHAQTRSRDSTNPSTAYSQWPTHDAGQAFGQWSPRGVEAFGQWSPRRDSRQAQTQWPPRDSQARARDPRNPSSAQTGPRDPRSQGINQRSVSFAQSGFSRSW
jgi:hypothetical protein